MDVEVHGQSFKVKIDATPQPVPKRRWSALRRQWMKATTRSRHKARCKLAAL